MGDPSGFLKFARQEGAERAVPDRLRDYAEFTLHPALPVVREQASRCMDCGIPFCHQGCPLGNLIPEWNDLVYRGSMDAAWARLHDTNNFPEITGRVCPAPCEASCVLNMQAEPVSIKSVERTLADHGMRQGFVPITPHVRLDQSVAIIGSGPAGLAAAQQLCRKGYRVTVYERDDRIGGLLRYGIPDFKLGKDVLDARITQMRAEGVQFVTGITIGSDHMPVETLRAQYDAVVLAGGARMPRDLAVPGRDLGGVHFAMDYLSQQNRRCAGDHVPDDQNAIVATGKRVVVIGGGDTGSDCVGTANRQGAASVTQLELMPKPPTMRTLTNPWPEWPWILRTSSSHREGCDRDWAIMTQQFVGMRSGDTDHSDHVTALHGTRVVMHDGRLIPSSPEEPVIIPADLVLLAMGFVGPERHGLLDRLGVRTDARGNVAINTHGATSVEGVFAAGDMSRGQSLVVWAIADGRRTAEGVDAYLMTKRRIH